MQRNREEEAPCSVPSLYIQFNLYTIEERTPWAAPFVSSALITVAP